MTNKPMLSVEREMLENHLSLLSRAGLMFTGVVGLLDSIDELRALLDKPVFESQYDGMTQAQAQSVSDGVDEILHGKPAAQHQGEPVMPGSEEFSHMSTIELRGYHAGWHAACMQNRSAEQSAPVALVIDIESAANKFAQCMGCTWEHISEQGRQSMREHAKAVVDASRPSGMKP